MFALVPINGIGFHHFDFQCHAQLFRFVPLSKSLTSAVTCGAVTHSWICNHSASRKSLKIDGIVDGLIARFRKFAKIRTMHSRQRLPTLYQWSRTHPEDSYRDVWSWITDIRILRCAWRDRKSTRLNSSHLSI